MLFITMSFYLVLLAFECVWYTTGTSVNRLFGSFNVDSRILTE